MSSAPRFSRRNFLLAAGGAGALALLARAAAPRICTEPPTDPATGLPRIDNHVHLDVLGLEGVTEHARQIGVKVGVVEHAGTPGHPYPVMLSTDADLERWMARLAPSDVYRGIQAEGLDWAKCFSKATLAKLDFVLTDAMTFVERDGRLVHLWKNEEVKIADAEDFMDRYVAHHEHTMASGPLSILAAPMYLPEVLQSKSEQLWTTKRMQRVIAAAAKHKVALEITASRRLPTPRFLQMAKAAGVKFSFGTNGRATTVIGHLDYCFEMARELKLKPADLFVPVARG